MGLDFYWKYQRLIIFILSRLIIIYMSIIVYKVRSYIQSHIAILHCFNTYVIMSFHNSYVIFHFDNNCVNI